jgi:hypothetical protein
MNADLSERVVLNTGLIGIPTAAARRSSFSRHLFG